MADLQSGDGVHRFVLRTPRQSTPMMIAFVWRINANAENTLFRRTN